MIELTNSTELTLAAGQTAVFDTVLLNKGCATCTRQGTGSIKLRSCGVYEVRFTGNIGVSGATGVAQLSIQMGGVTYNPSTVQSETSTEGDLNAVEKTFWLDNCCGDYSRLTVVNTGTTVVTIGVGSIFAARRICS